MATVNDMTFNDVSTLLTSMVAQATGKTPMVPTNTAEFVSVGKMALASGYDPITKAISQVLTRTIFSIRPYTAKFKGLEMSNQQWGAWERKLQLSDTDFETDPSFSLPADGSSVDMYTIKRPKPLELVFVGANTYELQSPTYFLTQLDNAFRGPDELASFWNMVTQTSSDQIEQAKENLCRYLLANMIAGKQLGNPTNVIHLLTEYNTLTGLELTAQTVYQPDNYKAFVQWAFSRIAGISQLMTERSEVFHTNITDHAINRHTPVTDQRVYIYAPFRYQTEMMAIADIYHDNFMTIADNESVNYWQSIQSPSAINITPTYLSPTGALVTPEEPVAVNNVWGIIFDREALGYTIINENTLSTPINAKGQYWNMFHHFVARYYNDFTENAVVLLLD